MSTPASTAAADPALAADPPQPRRRWRDRPRWLRWSAYAAILLVLALIAASVVGVVVVRRSFPQTSGTLTLDGLSSEVTVARDAQGVPQLYADTAEDLFFAQGFVQAQDRFYEMDVRRHITAGRLSEMFGSTTVETDKVVRTLGWRRVAERELALLDADTIRYLEAFSAGVNAYIDDHSPGEMSLEYTLLALDGLDYHVEQWTPADSVAWLKAMAWDLRGNMQDEVDRSLMSPRLDAKQIAELYPAYPYSVRRPIVLGGGLIGGRFDQDATGTGTSARAAPAWGARGSRLARRPAPRDASAARGALAAVRRAVVDLPSVLGGGRGTAGAAGAGLGSNAWVVDGEHSSTGEPILANDPHLAPTLPGVWYQMGLHCNDVGTECPFDVTGFTFAGFPGVIIGHNQQIAWGFTNLGPDVSDLYLEAVEGGRYLRGRTYRRFEQRRETIVVADGPDVTFTARSSVHGPLLSDVDDRYATVGADAPVPDGATERGTGYAVALSWTALTPGRTADAVFALDAATDWESFRDGARDFAVPSQNLVYADRAGHIGYQAPGLIPIRGPANRGDYPSPGWDRRYDWTGRYVPFDALPTVLDPGDGFVVTANQAVVDPRYPYYLGGSWSYGYRSQRIVELLTKKGTLGVGDMSGIQLDTRNEFAATLVPYLLDVDAGSHYYAAGQRLLRAWDLTQPRDGEGSAAAAYFNATWRALLARTFDDQLPASVRPTGNDRWFEVTSRLLDEPTSPWWDDVRTDGIREGRDDILRSALRDARDELVKLQSRREEDWTWGHQHTLELENQTVGQSGSGLVARLVNRGPWQLAGGGGLVNASSWDATEGYQVTAVPSMRMVVSLADLDDSTWINLTGASGHAFDAHYTDQTDLWADGRTLPWPSTRDAVAGATDDELTLTP